MTNDKHISEYLCILSREQFKKYIRTYHIPREVHPVLPLRTDSAKNVPPGKIVMFTRHFDYGNYRIPFSKFYVDVLRHFQININQFSVFGLCRVSHFEILCRALNIEPIVNLFRYFYKREYAHGYVSFVSRRGRSICEGRLDSIKEWHDKFFWVDEFVCPYIGPWCSSKGFVDPPLKPEEFNPAHVDLLLTNRAPFSRFPEAFLGWVGVSRYYPYSEDEYPRVLDGNGAGALVFVCVVCLFFFFLYIYPF